MTAAASVPGVAPRAVDDAEFERSLSLLLRPIVLGDAGSRFSPLLTSLARRTNRKTFAAEMTIRGRCGDGEGDAGDLGVGAAKGVGIRRFPSGFAAAVVVAVAVMALVPVVRCIDDKRHRQRRGFAEIVHSFFTIR